MKYFLSNDQLKVSCTTLGGTLSSIRDKNGTEYLWQGDKNYWSGTAPILFPICGSIRNNKAVIGEGQKTEMPRHGIVRKSEFQFQEMNSSEMVFSIEYTEETLIKYPYRFKLNARYRLEQKTVRITYEVENKGENIMPFFVGGHPGFRCPLTEGEKYSDYYLEFEQEENCTVPTPVTKTGLIDMEHRIPCLKKEKTMRLNHGMFHKDAVILDELKSRKVRLLSEKSQAGVEVEFQDFPYLILWSSDNGGPFLAIEPWIGLSTCSDEGDVFEEKRNVQFLESGKKKSYTYSITVL